MKKESDGILYNQKFNVFHNIDEKLKDPNFKVKIGKNEFTLGEINNLIPSEEKKLDIFVEWDNMCQYSAIGIVSLINELINEDRKLNLSDYIRRDKYPNGIDYVKNVIFSDIDPILIDKAITKYYSVVLSRSPITDFFTKINFMKFMLNSVTFMFRYNVSNLQNLMDEISEEKFNNEVTCKYVIYPTEEYEDRSIKELKTKELYVVPDMGLYYQSLLKYNKENTTIISYNNHNGVSPYILAYYFNDFEKNGLNGPNDITLDFLQEFKPTDKELKEEEKENDRH